MHTGNYYGLYELSLEKGILGEPPPPPPTTTTNFFFLKIVQGTYRIFLTESYVSFLEKANDAIFILIKVHFEGLWAPYIQTP